MNDVALDRLVDAARDRVPDWMDVMRRAERETQRKRRRVFRIGVVAFAALALAASATAARSWFSEFLDRETPSAERFSTRDRLALARMGLLPGSTGIKLIGSRQGRSIYALEDEQHRVCFASGRADDKDALGIVPCDTPSAGAPSFPTRPLFDLSVHEATGGIGSTVIRLEGVAAEGVAAVQIETLGGERSRRVPVIDNIYVETRDLPLGPIRRLIALGADGNELYSLCFADCTVRSKTSARAEQVRLGGLGERLRPTGGRSGSLRHALSGASEGPPEGDHPRLGDGSGRGRP